MGKLEWVYYVRLEDPSENDIPQEGPENNMIHQGTKVTSNMDVWRALEF